MPSGEKLTGPPRRWGRGRPVGRWEAWRRHGRHAGPTGNRERIERTALGVAAGGRYPLPGGAAVRRRRGGQARAGPGRARLAGPRRRAGEPRHRAAAGCRRLAPRAPRAGPEAGWTPTPGEGHGGRRARRPPTRRTGRRRGPAGWAPGGCGRRANAPPAVPPGRHGSADTAGRPAGVPRAGRPARRIRARGRCGPASWRGRQGRARRGPLADQVAGQPHQRRDPASRSGRQLTVMP